MTAAREPLTGRGWSVRQDQSGTTVVLRGDWIARDAAVAEADSARLILDGAGTGRIGFESDQLGRWDSALLAFLLVLRQGAGQRDITFDDGGLPRAAIRLLGLITETSADTTPAPDAQSFVHRAGDAVIAGGAEGRAVLELVGDTFLRGGAAIRGRARTRAVDLLICMYDAGIAALPIVTIVNILVGGILAFVGSVQLRKFGADIYISDLVGVAMVREMAALMTAIVMSGRTGGAYAAQIATMVGNEEIDALRAIGIPIYDYLVLPRVVALTCMMPLLYLYGCALGIFGGFVVAVSMLNISPQAFIDEIGQSVAGSQLVFGLVKSLAFGMLIALAGCRRGLTAGRGAADVGQAATTAVVIGIVGVIALDAVFAVCANALDF
jgi:phospholipid/cholesterol/gamma-HCH transport system permease protein